MAFVQNHRVSHPRRQADYFRGSEDTELTARVFTT